MKTWLYLGDRGATIQSHNNTHGNIKNTRSCIMQVLDIKGSYKDLYCCNWEKSQPFCKKNFFPFLKRNIQRIYLDCLTACYNLITFTYVTILCQHVEQAAINRNNRSFR